MIDLELEDAQEITNHFSYLTNNLFFTPNEMAEEYRGSRQMEALDLCWIKKLSSPEYLTDLRNEASSLTGKMLAGIPFVKERLENCDNPKMQEVAEKMACDHRTIQQTFSGLVFYHFMSVCNREERQILADTVGEDFYRLPLI